MSERTIDRADLTVSSAPTIYQCCGLFDLCGDSDLMSLSMAGSSKFLDWLGWQPSNECQILKYFIHWIRPEHTLGDPTVGYLSDPCATPNGYEWGHTSFRLEDWARLRRKAPVRDVTRYDTKLCAAQPRYRLDGTPITDDREWEIRLATEVLLQDLARMVITGNAATPGQFDGLQRLIRTGYTDADGRRATAMDSIVVDWNANPMTGGAGITWNGAAIAATFDFVDVLLAIYRRIRTRISMAPALAGTGLRTGDMILTLPEHLAHCLLDFYTCWSVCDGDSDAYKMMTLDTLEARRYRDSLNGGMFGDGRIFLDGFEIPLLVYNYETITGPTRGDMYLLTNAIGSTRLINGQYLDMRSADGGLEGAELAAIDGGRLLTGVERDYTCVERWVEMAPRLLSWAPWAQARITDVACASPAGPISPDPLDASYFIEKSFFPASCPPA